MLSEKTYELLKTYCTPHSPDAGEAERFKQLQKQKLIKIYNFKSVDLGSLGTHLVPDKCIITELGKDALSEFEQEHNKQAEEKRQQRFQNKISVLNLLVPFITFILGLLVEYFSGIVCWFTNLFH